MSGIYGVQSNGNLLWYRHDGRSSGDGSSEQWVGPIKASWGWQNFTLVFGGGEGVIYAIDEDSNLLWYRHNGRADGTVAWSGPKKVGTGWTYKKVFSGGDGIIYAIDNNGDLFWDRHDGWREGTDTWAHDPGRRNIGRGWSPYQKVFSGGEGVIYAIDDYGDLFWYRHHDDWAGSIVWANDGHPKKVASDWGFHHVFSAGKEIIYGITNNNDLMWCHHDGYHDGSKALTGPILVGTGFAFNTVCAGDGIIYEILDDGDLRWHKHTGWLDGTATWTSPDKGKTVHTAWDNFRLVFGGGEGVIYAICSNDDLWWYRHDGRGDGTVAWSGPNQVGNAWAFEKVFSGGDGIIYAIDGNGNVSWYRHDGRGDGTKAWSGPKEVGTGWSYPKVFSGGEGVIYAIDDTNHLRWHRYYGWSDGTGTWSAPNSVRHQWKYKHVFSPGGGILYAIDSNGYLLWYRWDGCAEGTATWANGGDPQQVGSGWEVFELVIGGPS